jgi:hypothetical protein
VLNAAQPCMANQAAVCQVRPWRLRVGHGALRQERGNIVFSHNSGRQVSGFMQTLCRAVRPLAAGAPAVAWQDIPAFGWAARPSAVGALFVAVEGRYALDLANK